MRRLIFASLIAVPGVVLAVFGPLVVGHALFAAGFRSEGAKLMGNAGWRGYMLAREGRYRDAAAAFGPTRSLAYDRGNALVHIGQYVAALDAYDTAIEADPEDADARYNRALIAKALDAKILAPGTASGNANAIGRFEKTHGGSGNQKGETNSLGNGYVGNQEAGTDSSTQGASKVARFGRGDNKASDANSLRASGSAGIASGAGRSGSDLADITQQLASNQRRYAPIFTAKVLEPNIRWLQTVPDDPGSFLKLQIRAEHKRRQEHEAQAQGDED